MGMNDEEKKENATQWLIMEAQSGDESAKEMLLDGIERGLLSKEKTIIDYIKF